MDWNLHIRIEEPFEHQVSADWLRQAVKQVMFIEGIDYPVELSLLVTNDETVRDLNRDYRGKDQSTDVLSFALQEGEAFPVLADGFSQLGEVIISCPQAGRQAKEQGHSLEHELAVLTVHGALHLLGYGHETDEGELQMKAREDRILADLYSM